MRREKAADMIEVAERGERQIEPPKAALRTESDARMHLFVGGGFGGPYDEAEIAALRVFCRKAGRDTGNSQQESLAYFRGVEILDSWTAWRAEVEAEEARSGLSEANKAFSDDDAKLDALSAQLANTPALTIEGILAKSAAMRFIFREDPGLSDGLRDDLRRYGPEEGSLALSLTRDLLSLVRSKEG
jgi:hypothetical protein